MQVIRSYPQFTGFPCGSGSETVALKRFLVVYGCVLNLLYHSFTTNMHQRCVRNYNYIKPSHICCANLKCCCFSATHWQITFSILLSVLNHYVVARLTQSHGVYSQLLSLSLFLSLTTTHIIAALCHAMCVTGSPRIGPGLHLITLLLPALHI